MTSTTTPPRPRGRPRIANKLVPQPFVLEPELRERLKQLSAKTRVAVNQYLREAVADVLTKYAHEFEAAKSRGSKARRP